MTEEHALERVSAYHERSKHQLGRFARSLGYLDWETQPDPFRRYSGAPLSILDEVPPEGGPTLDEVYELSRSPAPLNRALLSQLFYDSLALSAWKALRGQRWSLRCNPSSGNLHPTEGYLLTGPVAGLDEGQGGLYHYSPFLHALERRAQIPAALWREAALPEGALLLGLTSVFWRESWKYGERAFRYCQHDLGHAVAALSYAAAALGWQARLLEAVTDGELAPLLGLVDQEGPEGEHPEGLLVLAPSTATLDLGWRPKTGLLEHLAGAELEGRPNQLSGDHHLWPVIDEVAEATRKVTPRLPEAEALVEPPSTSAVAARSGAARRLFRGRRSAVAMDGERWLEAEDLYRMLAVLEPGGARPPLSALPWAPALCLVLFVHRVRGLEPGLYLDLRSAGQLEMLRLVLDRDFLWERPEGCPEGLELYLLDRGDTRQLAELISCRQEIAAQGAFAVSMLAKFSARLEEAGPWFYRRLFWEAGAIGQALYLEAEAIGARATGIGCYFDDSVHELLGLGTSRRWQSLYHLALGGAVEDGRLQTEPAYHHREAALRAAQDSQKG